MEPFDGVVERAAGTATAFSTLGLAFFPPVLISLLVEHMVDATAPLLNRIERERRIAEVVDGINTAKV